MKAMKMKTSYLFVLLAIFSVVVSACTQNSGEVMEKKDAMMEKQSDAMEKEGAMEKNDSMMKKDDSMMKDEGNMMKKSYTGNVLAGTEATKYIDFNKADYDKALKDKKKILLYFYANWCPLCKQEQVHTFAAFNEINDPELVGFRVNYKDSETDADEVSLAKEFGISYQHTKIIL